MRLNPNIEDEPLVLVLYTRRRLHLPPLVMGNRLNEALHFQIWGERSHVPKMPSRFMGSSVECTPTVIYPDGVASRWTVQSWAPQGPGEGAPGMMRVTAHESSEKVYPSVSMLGVCCVEWDEHRMFLVSGSLFEVSTGWVAVV